MIEEFDESMELGFVVECTKETLEIDKPNSEMTDAEIKSVAREIGQLSEDTTFDEKGQPIFGHKGISWMVTTVLYCFPKYWEKMGLAQFN
jgi:hypothetical protein